MRILGIIGIVFAAITLICLSPLIIIYVLAILLIRLFRCSHFYCCFLLKKSTKKSLKTYLDLRSYSDDSCYDCCGESFPFRDDICADISRMHPEELHILGKFLKSVKMEYKGDETFCTLVKACGQWAQ